VSCDKVVLSAPEDWAGSKKIGVGDRVHSFKAGDRLEFDCHLHGGGWRPLTHKVTRKTEGDAARTTPGGARRRRATKAVAKRAKDSAKAAPKN
jgi:hypothetical protein